LVTAILAGLVIGALSGGSFQISGPTGAMSAILITISAKYGIQGVLVACFLSGIILVLAGVLKLGNIVSFLPTHVITGFTSGIALIIVIGQIDNFTGLKAHGESTVSKLASYFTTAQQFSYVSFLIGLAVIAFMVLYPKKWSQFCPSSLAAIILITGANMLFGFNTPVVGEIPRNLFLSDRLELSSLNIDAIKNLIAPAVSIAALGLIESLLCGAAAGRMKDEKLNAEIELTAQGIGNMIIPFFGGVPATAAIARTSVAIKSGGQTRLTSVIHSCVLLLSMFVLAPVMSQIPLAALAGVLIVTAWRMNEWVTIRTIFKKRFYTAIMQFSITMVATVIFDLTAAIVIGVAISAIIFIINITGNTQVSVADVDKSKLAATSACHDKTCVIYITGPLFFGTANKIAEKLSVSDEKETVILSMRGVSFADISGTEALFELVSNYRRKGISVYFAGVQATVMETFRRCGITEELGEESFFWSADIALTAISSK
jgi:SulP family sulfate permease